MKSRTDFACTSVLLAATAMILVAASQPAYGVYDPKHGRWLQRDPAGYVDGMNLYEYVKSAPPQSVDALGRQASQPQGPSSQPTMCGRTVKVIVNGTPLEMPKGGLPVCERPCPTGSMPENGDIEDPDCNEKVLLQDSQTQLCEAWVLSYMRSLPDYQDMIKKKQEYLKNGDTAAAARCDPKVVCRCCNGHCGGKAFFVWPGRKPSRNFPTLDGHIVYCQEQGQKGKGAINHELSHHKSYCFRGTPAEDRNCDDLLEDEAEAYRKEGYDCRTAMVGAIMSSCRTGACSPEDVEARQALIERLYRQCELSGRQ